MGSRKIVINSILSILLGIGLSVISVYCQQLKEPVNYAGGLVVLGGLIFLDQQVVNAVFQDRKNKKIALVRLPVYFLLAIVFLTLQRETQGMTMLYSVFRSLGISFLLLALWKFFSFTTVEEKKINEEK